MTLPGGVQEEEATVWRAPDLVTVLESISDGFAAFDRQWRFTYVNRRATSWLRRRPEDLLGRVIWETFPEASNSRLYQELQRAQRENTPTAFEALHPSLDTWFEVRAFPSEEGVSIYFRDVTERRRADNELRAAAEALRSSEARLAAVILSARDAIVCTDEDGRIVLFNPAAEQMFGYQTAEALGRPLTALLQPDISGFIPPQEPDPVPESGPGLLWARRKDGVCFPVEASFAVADPEDDTVAAAVVRQPLTTVVLRDITDRLRAEQGRALLEQEREENAGRQRDFLREVLYSVTEGRLRLCDADARPGSGAALPEPLPPVSEPVALTPDSLAALRVTVRETAAAHGFPEVRAYDLMAAVQEAAMNVVQHGGGSGYARIHADSETLQVWVMDRGHGIDMAQLPRATLMKGYSGGGGFGHGFYLMLQSAEAIWLLTGPAGTTVVLQQNRVSCDNYGG